MSRRGSRALHWVLGLLSVALLTYALVVVALGASAVPGRSAAEQRVATYNQINRDADEGVSAFLTVDYQRIDQLTKRVRSHATGAFAKDYAANEVNLKAAATQAKAQTTGEVKSIGISKVDDTNATVYVAADSLVSNSSTKDVKKTAACPHDGKVCRYYRFKLSMSKDDGEWKIAQLEFVS